LDKARRRQALEVLGIGDTARFRLILKVV